MKFIDFLFYNLYSWYNVEGTFRKCNDPSRRASYLLGLSIGGWCIFIFLFLHVKPPFYQYITYLSFLIALISCGLIGFSL